LKEIEAKAEQIALSTHWVGDLLIIDGGFATELEAMGFNLKHDLWSALVRFLRSINPSDPPSPLLGLLQCDPFLFFISYSARTPKEFQNAMHLTCE
jgi:hypothetical protein